MFHFLNINSTIKKILLFILVVLAASFAKVLADRAASEFGPKKVPSDEITLQIISEIKKELPMKLDDVTTLFDVKFEKDGRTIVYFVSVLNTNKDDLYANEDISFFKENLTKSLCESSQKNFQNGYEVEFIYFGNDSKEMMRIFLCREICQTYNSRSSHRSHYSSRY